MHTYSTFWIKEEFRHHYFYKSDILVRFLQQYIKSEQKLDYIECQFNYITRKIPYQKLIKNMKHYHQQKMDVEVRGKRITLTLNGVQITIHTDERKFLFTCNSIDEADLLIFQPLKLFDMNFFIIEDNTLNSGWISPAKKEVLL